MDMSMRTALIAGATGLVGGQCLTILRRCPDYQKIIILTRRALALDVDTAEQRIVDFDHLSPADVAGADDIFCALGTTIKKAGSQAAFRKVDFDAIVNVARAGVEAGAKRFVLVSSVGADPKSSNFYLRVKGETEQAVSALPFETIHIMRPSLLLGHREESRAGEGFAQRAMPIINSLLVGPLSKYRAVSAETVASAMVGAARSAVKGVQVYEHDGINRFAELVGAIGMSGEKGTGENPVP